MDDKLATGIVGTSHGLEGFVKVHPYSDDLEHFLGLKEAVLTKGSVRKTLAIKECRLARDHALVRFDGFDSPEAARSLNGFVLWVDREDAAPLREGDYYVSDLVGLKVIHDGSKVGDVVSTVDGPQGVLLEVITDKDTHFIPFIDRYFGKVDLAAGTLELKELMLLS